MRRPKTFPHEAPFIGQNREGRGQPPRTPAPSGLGTVIGTVIGLRPWATSRRPEAAIPERTIPRGGRGCFPCSSGVRAGVGVPTPHQMALEEGPRPRTDLPAGGAVLWDGVPSLVPHRIISGKVCALNGGCKHLFSPRALLRDKTVRVGGNLRGPPRR